MAYERRLNAESWLVHGEVNIRLPRVCDRARSFSARQRRRRRQLFSARRMSSRSPQSLREIARPRSCLERSEDDGGARRRILTERYRRGRSYPGPLGSTPAVGHGDSSDSRPGKRSTCFHEYFSFYRGIFKLRSLSNSSRRE